MDWCKSFHLTPHAVSAYFRDWSVVIWGLKNTSRHPFWSSGQQGGAGGSINNSSLFIMQTWWSCRLSEPHRLRLIWYFNREQNIIDLTGVVNYFKNAESENEFGSHNEYKDDVEKQIGGNSSMIGNNGVFLQGEFRSKQTSTSTNEHS